VNKRNWKLTKEYLSYRLDVDQISLSSLKIEKTYLRYLLLWADERAFKQVVKFRPTFPEHMLSARLDGAGKPLSGDYIKKVLVTTRYFFSWLSANKPGYKRINQAWIKTLKIKRQTQKPKTKDAVTLDEIFAISVAPVETIMERRIRAAAVFLYLSGIRISAFVSLTLQLVDIDNREIIQDPTLGVRTKNQKYSVTYLLDIPELLKIVKEWDDEIRAILPTNGFWFALLSPDTGEIDTSVFQIGESRHSLARRNLKAWLEKVGLPYHSPHKFRHGHVQYGLGRSNTLADFKAVSLNASHSSIKTTDEYYSILNDDEVKNRITSLGDNGNSRDDGQEELEQFREFLAWKNGQNI